MSQVWTQVAGVIGTLIVGLLVGSWLGASAPLWWLIFALGVIAFGGVIIAYVIDKSRSKPLTKV